MKTKNCNLVQPPKTIISRIFTIASYAISFVPGIMTVAVTIGIVAVILNSVF